MKYHSATYSGLRPLFTMGARKLIATAMSPTMTTGSTKIGVSPHSIACAWPARMPIPVAASTACHAQKMNQLRPRDRTGRPVMRGMAQCSPPRKTLAMNPYARMLVCTMRTRPGDSHSIPGNQ